MYTEGYLCQEDKICAPTFLILSIDILASRSLRDPHASFNRRLVVKLPERVFVSLTVKGLYDPRASSQEQTDCG